MRARVPGPDNPRTRFIKSFKIIIIFSSISFFVHKIFISQACLQYNFRSFISG